MHQQKQGNNTMQKDLNIFIDKIMRLKHEAMMAEDGTRGRLLYALSLVQAHPFYFNREIMTNSCFCETNIELDSYINDRLITIIRHRKGL